MLAALEQAFPLDGETLDIGASVGVAVAPAHATQAEQLLSRADVAMYTAKGSLAGLAVFSAEQERDGAGRLALMSDLRRAVDEGELVLYYQPQIDLRTGAISSVEALVRWMHPKRGLVGPDEFIPLAERTGLIKRLTRTVLTEAIRQARAWELAGLRVPIAVNLSMRNVHDPQLPQTIAQLLQRWDARPDLLRLEITETVLAADPERALQTMDSLRAMGVHIALDDFGIGYSSLAYLNRLPLDQIKIDRSFVIGMVDDEASATIVRATVELGHGLGYAVVAEGVENTETRQRLTALGCDAIQGFLISRPMPADQTAEWIGRALVATPVVRPRRRDRHCASLAELPFRGRLAFRAHEHLVQAVTRAHDLRAAARAGIADLSADLHVRPDLRAELRRQLVLHDLDRARERLAQRAIQPVHLAVVEARDAALRMQLRLPQDLVRVRVPDPRDEVAAHQQIAQLAPRRLRATRELVRVPRQRAGLGALAVESRQVGGARARLDEIHLAHPRVVAIAQVASVLERRARADPVEGQRERGGGADLRFRRQDVEEAGEHRIDHQARVVVEDERQEAAAMHDVGERAALQRVRQRPRRAQNERVMHANGGDVLPDERRREAAAQDVEVGPLRH